MLITQIHPKSLFLVGKRDELRARMRGLLRWAQRQEVNTLLNWYEGAGR